MNKSAHPNPPAARNLKKKLKYQKSLNHEIQDKSMFTCGRLIFNTIVRNPIPEWSTRGSKFWSSKVCEWGESRGAYACQLTFDPPQFLFEISDHVTQFVRKLTFDPPSIVRTGSKLSFRSVWKRIKNGFESRDHQFRREIRLNQKWIGIHMLHVITFFTYFTGSKCV